MSSRARRRRHSRVRHDASVRVDGVRPAPALEARAADGRVDGVRGFLLVVEVADRARLAVRVPVARRPPPLALVPGHAPELRREPRERPQLGADGAHAEAHGQERDLVDLRASHGVRRRVGGFSREN